MNRFILSCISLLLLQSCISNKKYSDNGQQTLSLPSGSVGSGYFINHFEFEEIVPIQTSDSFLISDIRKVIRYRDKIVLFSGTNNTIFIINSKNGDIEKCINKVGNGPGESKTILDIAFDELSEQILVYNDYSKLLFFDIQGKFLSEIKVDGLYDEICSYKGDVVFYNELMGYSCSPYKFKIFNLNNKTWKEIGRDEKIDFPIRSQGRQFVKSKQMWFTAPLDFNLYMYEDNQIQCPYEIVNIKSGLDENLIKKSASNPQMFFQEVTSKNMIYSINSIRETIDYIIFRSNREGFFIIDKKENKIHWDKFVEEKALGMNLTFYYPHEGDDNKIMFVLQAGAYVKHIRSNPQYNIISREIKEDDNPILIFYKQKDKIKEEN